MRRVPIDRSKALWMIGAALLIVIIVVCLHSSDGRFVTSRYQGRIEFVGYATSVHVRPRYFSARIVETSTEEAVAPDCPLILLWKGKRFQVSKMTPGEVKSIGGSVSQPDYLPAGHLHGNICGFDTQNRDFCIEWSFKNDKIIGFYARFNQETGCPFQIAFEGGPPFAFPLSQKELFAHVGQPESIETEPAK